MKQLLFLFNFICIISFTFSQTNPTGEWKGKDGNGKEASIIFSKDSSVTLIFEKMVWGSKDTTLNKSGFTVKYVFDFTKNPIWLDLNIYNSSGHLVNTLRSIVKYETKDKMIWAKGVKPNIRPESIDLMDKQNTILLYKIE